MVIYPFFPYPLLESCPRNKHEARFWGVHALKPSLYERFDIETKKLLRDGRDHHAIDHLFNLARWNGHANMDPPEDDFKINNNYRPYYARLWLQADIR